MTVTRDVILDLLPLYFAGQVSADTKALVDEFLRTDPDFARMSHRFDALLKEGRAASEPDATERRAFERTPPYADFRGAALLPGSDNPSRARAAAAHWRSPAAINGAKLPLGPALNGEVVPPGRHERLARLFKQDEVALLPLHVAPQICASNRQQVRSNRGIADRAEGSLPRPVPDTTG